MHDRPHECPAIRRPAGEGVSISTAPAEVLPKRPTARSSGVPKSRSVAEEAVPHRATARRAVGERRSEAVRFTRFDPDPRLRAYVSGYHRYETSDTGLTVAGAFAPHWATFRFALGAQQWNARHGLATTSVPRAALFGPTARATFCCIRCGSFVGAELTPAGWARLIGGDASRYSERIGPLKDIIGRDADRLFQRLARGEPVTDVLDGYFLGRLDMSDPLPAETDALLGRLADAAPVSITALAEALGLTRRALLRLTRRTFGFNPKLLQRRERFLQATLETLAVDKGRWSEHLGKHGYRDQSHFVKDCNDFLGRSLGSFRALHDPANGSFVHWPQVADMAAETVASSEDGR